MLILRDYQEAAIDGLRDGFRAGHDRQVLSASTGAGKSIIMMSMVKSAIERGTRTIFICERRNLVTQFSAHLDNEGIDHGIIMASTWRWRPDLLIQVASAQTLEKMEALPDFRLMFVDEVHANMRQSIVRLIESRKGLKVVGATATPFHPLIPKYFTNVVSAPPMRELVERGNLVPFRVFAAKEINTDGLPVITSGINKGEWKSNELETRGRQVIGDIVADYIRLSSEIHGRNTKAICFSCGIAHGADLVESFNAAGINAIQLAAGVDEQLKTDVLREFSKPDSTIDVLISVDMLSRGFDQTDIEHVIIARPLKKSFSTHVQMIGRGARSHPEKSFCIVQDHANNWLRFLDEWNEFFDEGVKTLESDADAKPKKEPTVKEKEAAKCPRCGALWPGGSDVCLHCGNTRIRKNDVTALPGEMLELVSTPAKPAYTSAYKESFYHGLIGYLRSQGKNENSAYHLYKEMFGVYPT